MKTKATLIFAGLLLGLNMHAQYFSLDLDSKLFEFDKENEKENEKVNTHIYTTADYDELKIYFGRDNPTADLDTLQKQYPNCEF
ncbi:hypothetical protein ACK1KB_12795 [Chryseobacterium sp. TY3]